MTNFANFVTFLSSEFHHYLMEHEPEVSEIPRNALIVFDVAGEPAFSQWHHEVSMKNREPGQPVIKVHVGKLHRRSAMENVELATVNG